ncbi:SDR family NAD(P)-dependent oxidoreductase [Acetobacterium bakii]|uniref:3-oxoacyl-ACP reductase n=1 Tax=Acetobacterium bakii TaxID=52689 RepID=A0A0L6TZ55_9FIRM|nr:SDR family NAD(P)-dependent oxidoreductase [Acetobacterium bakii]KNZ41538.1 3-oxoacyl-ACP reductase [Acetobacterium bakii]
MDLKLQGKNAIITGGSRGVGRAIALGLAAEGVNIAVTARALTPNIQAVIEEAKAMGVKAYAIAANLENPAETIDMMQEAQKLLGDLDILINNAGIWLTGWIQDIPLEDWELTMNVNLTAPFQTSQFFAKANLEKGRPGKIINVNSQAAFNGSTTGHAHYAASKAGMVALTISMARELSSRGITVNGIALGVVDTDLIRENIKANPGYYESRIPIGRVAQPEDVANIVVFLASEPAAYLTGTTLDATGGMLMR